MCGEGEEKKKKNTYSINVRNPLRFLGETYIICKLIVHESDSFGFFGI